MLSTPFRLIDNNTGETLTASSAFQFLATPQAGHVIQDPDLAAHFGGRAIVQRVEILKDETCVYVDSSGEVFNDPNPEI